MLVGMGITNRGYDGFVKLSLSINGRQNSMKIGRRYFIIEMSYWEVVLFRLELFITDQIYDLLWKINCCVGGPIKKVIHCYIV